ncbi:cuticle protein 19.8-like [Daktulosphaira vitifoliae]|uniref:cuticle protein 19.8-like n=1 Tax=Daktulosphaira vitifoliae TaxID=58002 RepID=UPI0021AA9FC2|nr:cuticle protein 19.8-like [Daktulosphaira vitifoliae]
MQCLSVMLVLAASVCMACADDLAKPTDFKFSYGVNDPATGDNKEHTQVKNGDVVSGFYRTLDADGMMRTVNYYADPITGFNADVVRTPASELAPVAPALAPVAPVTVAAKLPAFFPNVEPFTPVTLATKSPAFFPNVKPFAPFAKSAYSFPAYPHSLFRNSFYPHSLYPEAHFATELPFSRAANKWHGAYPFSTLPYSYGAYPYNYESYPSNYGALPLGYKK